jgi:hypothetical protein
MKRVIRRGVFETNSSSMHSIVVTKNDVVKKGYFDYYSSPCNKKISLTWSDDIEFERSPFEILATAIEKFYYAVASFLGGATYEHLLDDNEPDEYLKEMMASFDSLASSIFEDCNGVDYPDKLDCYSLGHVDHESCGLLKHFLEIENISLEEFIKNPKYIVVIDGDEYCVFNSMKKAGLIKEENIVKEVCCDNYFYNFTHKEDAKF